MSTTADLFHFVASIRVASLSAATRALFDACHTAPGAPELIDWRDADHRLHDPAQEMPDDEQSGVGLTFADDAAFGVLERKDDGTFGLGVQHVVADLSQDAQRAALVGWSDVCRALLTQGVLTGARLSRQSGGHCVPYLPLVTNATHLVVCSSQQMEHSFVDVEAFTIAWASVEAYGEMRLCLRAVDALSNPNFLARILPGQMAMSRAARPGLTRFYQLRFEPGERELLEVGDPTLVGVGYHPGTQVYEFAGHTPPGIELRCIDLLTVWKVVTDGQVDGYGPVREVRVVFMDEEQAARSSKLLQEAGATVFWEDGRGEIRQLPTVLP